MDKYTFTKEEKESEITLTVKITPEAFVEVKNKTYNRLAKDVEIQGFRPGKAPKALIEAHISDKVYNETINTIVPEVTSDIFVKEKMNPLTQVSYEITKMSDADGIEYKATFVEYPKITLGDFKKIKIEKKEKVLTDEELEKQMINLIEYYRKAQEPVKQEAPATEGEVKAEEKAEDKKEDKKEPIVVTDELVKSLNIGFENVAALKEQIKKEIEAINSKDSEAVWLEEVVTEAVKLSKIEAPKALLADSVGAREKEYLKKLEELNIKLDEFLKVQNTTIEKLRADWETEAKKKLANELLLLEIIKQNDITVTQEEIDKELANVTDQKTKDNLQTDEGRKYLVTMMLQEKAIDTLKKAIA